MMMADVMDALGLAGKYVVWVNNRKVLDGVLDAAGVTDEGQKLTVLRAVDKLDKFGPEGVKLLLGAGRKDESGDFTKGAGLSAAQADAVLDYIGGHPPADNAGIAELEAMRGLCDAAGYGPDRIKIDPSVVRGLEHSTGPVFAIELTFKVQNEKAQDVVFGSVG